MHEYYFLILDCLLIGATSGIIYGLFGSGGGIVMIPGYIYALRHFSLADHYQMQIAIATTATTCAVIAASAAKAHYKAGNVDMKTVKRLIPGLLIGTVLAIALLNVIPSVFLKHLFAIAVIFISIWLCFYKAEKDKNKWSLDSKFNHFKCFVMGLLWFLLGIAVFTVPYLLKNGTDLRKAVGSATVISAIFSTIAGVLLITTGAFTAGISWSHLGYFNLPLSISTLISSIIVAYYTSKLSHHIPRPVLKYSYAGLVLLVGILML